MHSDEKLIMIGRVIPSAYYWILSILLFATSLYLVYQHNVLLHHPLLTYSDHTLTHSDHILNDTSSPKNQWFAIQLNQQPIRYFNRIQQIQPLKIMHCLQSITLGDLLKIQVITDSICHVKIEKMPVADRIALHIPLSLNHCTQEELTHIKGIGPSLAQRIIKGRPWKHVQDLIRLKGVGIKKLNKITPYLTLKSYPLIYNRFHTM